MQFLETSLMGTDGVPLEAESRGQVLRGFAQHRSSLVSHETRFPNPATMSTALRLQPRKSWQAVLDRWKLAR